MVSAAGVLLVVFAQLGDGPRALRPAECAAADGAGRTNAWERAKEPSLGRYCDLLASGSAKLVGGGARAGEVPGLADEADRVLPGRAAPGILKARALLRLGKADAALAALTLAISRDERALDEPVALLVWARAQARTGHSTEAARAYRAALPRISALPAAERASVALEAALAVLREGPAAVDDAVAMLRQARRDAPDALGSASTLALALALDRAGQRDEARAVLAERPRSDARALVGEAPVAAALADAGASAEADALAALALEPTDAAAAREAWRRYVDAVKTGPWVEHARQHLAAAPRRAAGKGTP